MTAPQQHTLQSAMNTLQGIDVAGVRFNSTRGAIAGGAIRESDRCMEQAQQKPRAESDVRATTALESAMNRADGASRELAHVIEVLEARLDRVLEVSPIKGANEAEQSLSSSAPIIAMLEDLTNRKLIACRRLHSIIDRLAV